MKMKKVLFILFAVMMSLSLVACTTQSSSNSSLAQSGGTSSSSSVTVTTLNGAKESVQLQVPYNPKRIAVMDLATLDILDNLGLGDRVVGVSKGSSIDYLQNYMTDNSITNLGTIKEVDMEALMSCEPDIIFIGGRLADKYDELSKIAPVVYLAIDTQLGVVESVRNNATTVASIFGAQDSVQKNFSDFDSRIQALTKVSNDKTAIIGMCTSGGFNVLGNDGRCSMIGKEIGFNNLAAVDVTSTHGNESSFELLVNINPDYVFVLDRDAAIGTDGAQPAKEIMENELVIQTDAYKNNRIVYLDRPAIWYTAEGGITALDYMLADLEKALL